LLKLGQIRAHQDQRLMGWTLLQGPDVLGGEGLDRQGRDRVGGEKHWLIPQEALKKLC
jgi:hypothetical protein